ncbi:MAG TPA: hypothetical protein VH583_14070 [Vicinamibacterales bacterium]|jgi:hypothetical protein
MLDTRWAQLMALCERESTYQQDGSHPRLARLIKTQIDQLAADMGFSPHAIETRDFRAERADGHITRIITD